MSAYNLLQLGSILLMISSIGLKIGTSVLQHQLSESQQKIMSDLFKGTMLIAIVSLIAFCYVGLGMKGIFGVLKIMGVGFAIPCIIVVITKVFKK